MLDLSSWQAKTIFAVCTLLIGCFLFFPVYWLFISSLKVDAELYALEPTFYPHVLTLEHFRKALFEAGLGLQLTNSLIVSLSSAAINATLAVYAGYSFAKYRYFGRRPVMLFMLSAQMFPFGLLLITIYPMFTDFGLIDTRFGLMISYIVFALPVATYMLYSYFSQVPNELIEAARADGASDLRIFHTIVLPISLPPIITVFLYSFMWSWKLAKPKLNARQVPLANLVSLPQQSASCLARIPRGVSPRRKGRGPMVDLTGNFMPRKVWEGVPSNPVSPPIPRVSFISACS